MTFLNTEFFENKFRDLLKHLDSQDLSVLIGAGFSKNVNQKLFPSWCELLEKMVLRMFEKQYKYDFKEKEGRPWHTAKLKYNNYIKGRIEQYIEKEGYLDTVSNYIVKMGFRETVELYIEEHTPIATVDDGQNVLLSYENGERTKRTILTESDLSIHKSLLRLPWSNIFTTNYDNLLEFCSKLGDDIVEKLLKEYQQQINYNKTLLQEKRTLVEKLCEDIDKKERGITTHFLSKKTEGQNISTKEYKKEETEQSTSGTNQEETLEDLQRKKLLIEKEIELIEKEQTNISSKITDLKSNTSNIYSEIIHSSQLEIKRSKNIVKLHGTIRKLRNDPFAFDDDYSKCYVISKEDYESYPIKHEAFTQLMRISLLQGYFCLIGFSGDDPNFIAWIGWIRDIVNRKIHKENASGSVDEIKDKIYFIDVTANKAANTHRQQFYNNHKIVHIPLAHPNSISTLSSHFNKAIDPENPKEILDYFLKYLKEGAVINQQQAEVEVKLREYYENFFKRLPYIGEEVSSEKLKQICQDFLKIRTLKPYARIASIEFSIDLSRRNYLNSIDTYLVTSSKDREQQKNLLSIMVQIIWDSYARPSLLVENFQKHIELSKTLCLDLYHEFLLLDMFDAVWLADEDKVDRLYKALTVAGNNDAIQMANFLASLHKKLVFNMKELNEILNEWQPQGHWEILKKTFIQKTNKPDSKTSLKKHQFPYLQEELHSLELQRFFSRELMNPQMNDRINNLRSAKMRSIYKNFDYLEESFKDKIGPIKPLGGRTAYYY